MSQDLTGIPVTSPVIEQGIRDARAWIGTVPAWALILMILVGFWLAFCWVVLPLYVIAASSKLSDIKAQLRSIAEELSRRGPP